MGAAGERGWCERAEMARHGLTLQRVGIAGRSRRLIGWRSTVSLRSGWTISFGGGAQ